MIPCQNYTSPEPPTMLVVLLRLQKQVNQMAINTLQFFIVWFQQHQKKTSAVCGNEVSSFLKEIGQKIANATGYAEQIVSFKESAQQPKEETYFQWWNVCPFQHNKKIFCHIHKITWVITKLFIYSSIPRRSIIKEVTLIIIDITQMTILVVKEGSTTTTHKWA